MLYEAGYDSYFFDEDDLDFWGIFGYRGYSGPVIDEVDQALTKRYVTHVGVMGHSHGGGKVRILAEALEDREYNYTLDITAYVDAIRVIQGYTDGDAETIRPAKTKYHANFYQLIDWIHGNTMGTQADKDVDVNIERSSWDGDPFYHTDMDDPPELHEELFQDFNAKMIR